MVDESLSIQARQLYVSLVNFRTFSWLFKSLTIMIPPGEKFSSSSLNQTVFFRRLITRSIKSFATKLRCSLRNLFEHIETSLLSSKHRYRV